MDVSPEKNHLFADSTWFNILLSNAMIKASKYFLKPV